MCHFLQCPEKPCQDKSLNTLGADACNSDYHPVRYLLIAGLKHWYRNLSEPFQPEIESFPQHMQPAIQSALLSQARIGWYQAMKGFLSKRWLELACQDMHDLSKVVESKGLFRMNQIMTALYAHNLRTWTSRNEVLHSTGDPTAADI